MAKPIRILLAEDHAIVRAGIAALLRGLPRVEVVAEAANGHEALRLINESHPTLVLADIALPSLNGIEVLARIRKDHPEIRVIMVSMHKDEEHVRHALQLGAYGFLAKDSLPEELALAVNVVEHGNCYLSPKITSIVTQPYALGLRSRENPRVSQQDDPILCLTPRQREVLQLVAEGHSSKDIAVLLNLTTKTVEVHRMQLMKRLDIHDVAGLVRYAVRYGITEVD